MILLVCFSQQKVSEVMIMNEGSLTNPRPTGRAKCHRSKFNRRNMVVMHFAIYFFCLSTITKICYIKSGGIIIFSDR